MKIETDLKCKIPSITISIKNKATIIRWWGWFRFDKVIIYES